MNEKPFREITLTKGYVALIDEDDFERVSLLKWSVRLQAGTKKPQAFTTQARKDTAFFQDHEVREHIFLHAYVLHRPGVRTQPKNGNWLDCRKANFDVLPPPKHVIFRRY